MPTSVKYREKNVAYGSRNTYSNTYDRQLYGNTSSAYDIPPVYPGRTVKSKPVVEEPKQKTTPRTFVRADLRRVFAVVGIIFCLCCITIYRYAAILESNQIISDLEKQYTDVLATNQALQTKIDRGLEMGEIERFAREELGMMRPEAYQMFYVDMKLSDDGDGEMNAEDTKNMLSGTPGALVHAFRVLK